MGASMGNMTIGNEIIDTEQGEDTFFDNRLFKSTQKGLLNNSRLIEKGGTIIRMRDKQVKSPITG